jgi:hypothetical protein
MPSPFPGMDPYLEHPALGPGVHQRFITYVGDALNAVLPAHYIADIGERLYIIQPERSIYERMSRGPHRCCMTMGSAREVIVPLESSRPSVQPSAPVAPRHQQASRWHPHAGASPLTGLSSLSLAVSANAPLGRDARNRG